MRGQLSARGKFQAVFGELGGDSDEIRNDEGDNEFALIANDHGVEDVGTGFQRVFDGLRSYEFSRGGFE